MLAIVPSQVPAPQTLFPGSPPRWDSLSIPAESEAPAVLSPKTIAFASALLLLFLSPALSLADGIPAPPEQCPPGSHPFTSHNGTGCAPNVCPLGAKSSICGDIPCCLVPYCGPKDQSGHEEGDCFGAGLCQEVKFCVDSGVRRGGGQIGQRFQEVKGSCEDSCPDGTKCERFLGCVDTVLVRSPEFKQVHGSCGCDIVGSAKGNEWLFLAAALACLFRKRRDKGQLVYISP